MRRRGFTPDDFTADAGRRDRDLPGRVTRQITARNVVVFGAARRTCPLRAPCTTSKDGRTLHWHEHHGLLRAALQA